MRKIDIRRYIYIYIYKCPSIRLVFTLVVGKTTSSFHDLHPGGDVIFPNYLLEVEPSQASFCSCIVFSVELQKALDHPRGSFVNRVRVRGGKSPCLFSVVVFDHLLFCSSHEYPCHSSGPNSNRDFFFFSFFL